MPMTVVQNGEEKEVQEVRLISCTCGEVDHHVIVTRYDWSDDPAVKEYEYGFYITLATGKPFLDRLWLAFKYAFGIEKKAYHYHDIVLTETQFKAIPELFDK